MNIKGETPLHVAVERQNFNCVAALLLNRRQPLSIPINANAFNDSGLTPFLLAVSKNDVKMCEILVKLTQNDNGSVFKTIDQKKGFGALHIAVENRATEVIEYLLKDKRVDVNQKTESNLTALSIARDIDDGMGDIIAILLKHGADRCVDRIEAGDENNGKSVAVNDAKGISNEISVKLAKVKLVDVKAKLTSNWVMRDPQFECSAEPIDSDSMNRLCEIFNKDDKWQNLAETLGYQTYIRNWMSAKSPSRAVFMFAEVH